MANIILHYQMTRTTGVIKIDDNELRHRALNINVVIMHYNNHESVRSC